MFIHAYLYKQAGYLDSPNVGVPPKYMLKTGVKVWGLHELTRSQRYFLDGVSGLIRGPRGYICSHLPFYWKVSGLGFKVDNESDYHFV